MAKGKGKRPPGRGQGGRSRPPGRWGYKPDQNTGGTRHTTGGCMLAKLVGATVLGFLATALAAIALAMVTA